MKDRLIATPSMAVLCAAVVALAACSKENVPATQVAATVNGTEISIHQVNFALARIPGIPPEMTEPAKRELIGKLIDQELAVQQAVENKLDRTPEVIMAIEVARKEVLSRAYVDQLTATVPRPGADEIKKYYGEHPELFAQRRIFNVQEIVLAAQGAPLDKLNEMIKTKSMEDVAKWLKQQNIQFSASAVTRSAEQIPLELLRRVQEIKDGQTVILASPQIVSIVRVVASESAPIDETNAQTRIQQYLLNQRVDSKVATEIKQLRDKAKIETASAEPKPDAPAVANRAKPAAVAETANLEKGISGLK